MFRTRNFMPLLFGTMAVLSAMSIGADMGLLNIALPHLRQGTGMNDGHTGTLSAALPLGAMLGALLIGVLSDALGRKKAMLGAMLLFGSGVALFAGSHAYPLWLAGRLVTGCAVGMFFGVVPVFLTESLDSKMRGICLALFTLATSAGTFLAMGIGARFDLAIAAQLQAAAGQATETARIHNHAWRTLMMLGTVPAALLLPVVLYGPESPRWLFGRGRKERAKVVLLREHEPALAELILHEMEELGTAAKARENTGDSLWQRRYLLPLCLGLAVFVLNNLVGTGVLNTFSTTLFGQAGLDAADAANASTWMGVLSFLGSVAGLPAVLWLGRKVMMGWGLAGGILSAGAAVFILWRAGHHANPFPESTGWLVFGCTGVYQFSLAFGPGVCGWLVVSELFPIRVRSQGMGLGVLLGALSNMGIMQACLPIVTHLGFGVQWALWGGVSAIYFCFVLFILPETRGKTLEEIEVLFVKNP